MSQARWQIKTAQEDVGVESADPDVATPNPDQNGETLPPNFATRLGMLAILNYLMERFSKLANDYQIPAQQYQQFVGAQIEQFKMQNKLKDADFVTAMSTGGASPDTIRATTGEFQALFNTLVNVYDKQDVEKNSAEAMQYCEEPADGSYNGGKGSGQNLWRTLGGRFQTEFEKVVNEFRRAQTPTQPYAAQVPQAQAPRAAAMWSRTKKAQFDPMQQPQQPGPLATGQYQSVSQLRDELISLGPKPETYEKIMTLVGPDREDDAKDALASFFQGLSASLFTLYDMLVTVGVASPIDAEIVEKLMSQHPELSDEGKEQEKSSVHAGLFLPIPTSGLNTMEKTAGGSVGGAGSGYPAYTAGGCGENRMCPKIRQPVSTFICRYHCLDGLNIDDHQTLCGEAIWRQTVMDKFSREYRDKDGKWVGGYLNKRFEIQQDDGGHPALIKPGERSNPIHEDAWSLEKRLAEMRKTESKSRGYSETPGDGPKDLYNFDQHDIKKGPKSPQLTEKKKDGIAKLANADSMFAKTAQGDPFKDVPWAKPTSEEGKEDYEPTEQDLKDVKSKPPKSKKGKWPPPDSEIPWAKDEKKSFNLKRQKLAHGLYAPNNPADRDYGGDKSGGGDPLAEKNVGKVGMQCPFCGKKFAPGRAGVCDVKVLHAGTPNQRTHPPTQLQTLNQGQATQMSGAVDNTGMIPAASDAEIIVANGIYRASKNGVSAYGDTAEQAFEKLARGLAETSSGSFDEEAMDIMNFRRKDEGMMKEMAPAIQNPMQEEVPVGNEVPPMAPAVDPQQKIEFQDGVSVDKTSPIPSESQGPSEFFPPETVPPTGWQVPGEDDGSPHVDAGDLDKELEAAAAGMHPEEHKAIVEQAISSGAHPRQGE